ncbi:MAG: FecR domain-containing protein [Gemmatimonadaceae bacterium]
MTDHLPQPDSDHEPADQWSAIARFLAGESSAAEAAEMRRWFADHPGHTEVVATLDAMLPIYSRELLATGASVTSQPTPVSAADVEIALSSVRARMETSVPVLELSKSESQTGASARVLRNRTGPQRTAVSTPQKKLGGWQVAGMAAAASIVTAMGVSQWKSSQAPAATLAVTYESKIGVQDSITLPDSSRVILAPGSKLIVAANYGQGKRDVELQGAGQFTVKHDASRPFSVRMGTALIQDLGTKFIVKQTSRAEVLVSVMEGSVSLTDASPDAKSQPVELKAGDRGRLSAKGNPVAELGAVTPEESAWLTGKLSYKDASLAEVQADLLRWYGVELVIRDSVMASKSITADALAGESVGKLLEKIAMMKGGVALRSGDTAFINRSGDRLKH